jgi:hypothetical protein
VQEIKKDVALDQGPTHHFFSPLSIDLLIEEAPLGKAHQNPIRTFTVAANLHVTNGYPKIVGGDFLFQYLANLMAITGTGLRRFADCYAGSLLIGLAKVWHLRFHATSLYFILGNLGILVISETLAHFYSNILAAALATSNK